jgi:tetratricopeptide (TPR) repeat protein
VAETDALAAGLAESRAGRAGGPVIMAICGMAGVGKTALAVRWAQQNSDAFPDGQLFVNLRGFEPSGSVVATEAALRGFLDAFEVPPERIPDTAEAQAALYRSLLGGRRVLVVLDNARDAEQVRPLLPGPGRCLVLVTSRDQLPGLVTREGASPLSLRPLPPAQASELLRLRLGAGRTAAEPAAVAEIVAGCAGLPLALAIVAANAATHPDFPLSRLAERLQQARDRLAALAGGEASTDIRVAFAVSYRALTPPAARLFRLLGLFPAPQLSAPAGASLAALPVDRARHLLAELVRANLLVEQLPDRYQLHDLLRSYAIELSGQTGRDRLRQAAIRRSVDHYLHSAYAADQLLNRHRNPIAIPLAPPVAGVSIERVDDPDQALAWFRREHAALLGTVRLAVDTGADAQAWQLAWGLTTYLDRQGHWHDLAATRQAALDAASRLEHPAAQAYDHHLLAGAHTHLGHYRDAHAHAQRSLEMYARLGDQLGQANSHQTLAVLWERQSRPDRAVDHARQALRLYQARGDRRGGAIIHNVLGWCHRLLGDHSRALEHCRQALALFEELADRGGQAETWDSIGCVHDQLGDQPAATGCYRRALELFRDAGERYGEAVTLIHLGDSHRASGAAGAAEAVWRSALGILDELDHPDAAQVRTRLGAPARPAAGHPGRESTMELRRATPGDTRGELHDRAGGS